MKINSISNMVFMDIGSTIIKYVRFSNSDKISDGGYFPRNYNIIVGDQVVDILFNQLGFDSNYDKIRICSSANGGLRVGVIGYTERFSSRWAERSVFNAGANAIWCTTVPRWGDTSQDAVDILVIAGGFDGSPIGNQVKWIKAIFGLSIIADSIIFTGNISLKDEVFKLWPNSVLASNIIGEDMSWLGDELTGLIRGSYLNDLVDKKGISGLQKYSEATVIPTPAVVEKAFSAIVKDETDFHVMTPLLLLDVGGATTDVFYGSELIAEECGNSPFPSINRFVFTNLGVFASRKSLLARLSFSDGLADFLRIIFPETYERHYISIREGNSDDMTEEILAYGCYYLALKSCGEGKIGNHRLELNKVSTLILTGGASQLCQFEILNRLAELCGMKQASIKVDKEYKVWIEGMKRLSNVKKRE
jgi:hypothetical protein